MSGNLRYCTFKECRYCDDYKYLLRDVEIKTTCRFESTTARGRVSTVALKALLKISLAIVKAAHNVSVLRRVYVNLNRAGSLSEGG